MTCPQIPSMIIYTLAKPTLSIPDEQGKNFPGLAQILQFRGGNGRLTESFGGVRGIEKSGARFREKRMHDAFFTTGPMASTHSKLGPGWAHSARGWGGLAECENGGRSGIRKMGEQSVLIKCVYIFVNIPSVLL